MVGVASVMVDAEAGLKLEGTGGVASISIVISSLVAIVSLLPAVSWQATYMVLLADSASVPIWQVIEVVVSPVQLVSPDISSYASSVSDA